MKKATSFLAIATFTFTMAYAHIVMRQTGTEDAPIGFGRLTVEGRTTPQGLDDRQPRFGWQLVSDRSDVLQTGYQLIVSSSPEGNGDVWDSGKVENECSQWVPYCGPALQPNKEYFWQVRVTTNKGASNWSAVQKWTTGLLSNENWQGTWIGLDSLTPDVTDNLTGTSSHQSANIEVILAGGYFFPMTQNFQTNVRTAYGMPKLLLPHLHNKDSREQAHRELISSPEITLRCFRYEDALFEM